MSSRMRLCALVAFVATVAASACNGQLQPSPAKTGFGPNRLYAAVVGFINSSPTPTPTPGAYIFASPFSSASTPLGVVTETAAIPALGIAVDPNDPTGTLYLTTLSPSGIAVFPRPAGATSAPLFAITSGFIEPVSEAFDAMHDLFVADAAANKIFELIHPISASTVPTALTISGTTEPVCVALDASGNLYVLDNKGTQSAPQDSLEQFSALSGAPAASTMAGLTGTGFQGQGIEGCAYDSVTHMMYVANALVSSTTISGAVLGYATPLSNGASQVTTIAVPAKNAPFGMTFDSTGTLYVDEVAAIGPATTSVIAIYPGPVSSASVFSTAIPDLSSNPGLSLQLAVGP